MPVEKRFPHSNMLNGTLKGAYILIGIDHQDELITLI
jgi:hypothetical protein